MCRFVEQICLHVRHLWNSLCVRPKALVQVPAMCQDLGGVLVLNAIKIIDVHVNVDHFSRATGAGESHGQRLSVLFVWTGFIRNALTEIFQILHQHSLGIKGELIRFLAGRSQRSTWPWLFPWCKLSGPSVEPWNKQVQNIVLGSCPEKTVVVVDKRQPQH